MALQVFVSEALKLKAESFPPGKLYAFQLAVADIAKGRADGEKVFSRPGGREYYLYRRYDYSLYFSRDPQRPQSLVFEEFLSSGEEQAMLDVFAEGPDK